MKHYCDVCEEWMSVDAYAQHICRNVSEYTGTAVSIDGWFGLTSKEAAELNNISKLQVKQTTQRQLGRYLFLVRKSIRLYMDSLKESQ